VIDAIKAEPAVTAGGTEGAIAAVITWQQTNQIVTIRQALTLGVPIAVGFVIRVFVTPNSRVALTQAQLALLRSLEQPPGQNTNPGTPPNTPGA
jgi:hypothetical protein